ncbi:MAG: SDR family oxidoreductase [Gemmatimonadales bacterium]
MDLGLTGRVALVCGGSSGLGFAFASRLLQEGAQVALNGRDPGKLDQAAQRLRKESWGSDAQILPFPADVSDAGAATALVARVHEAMGGPDILLCNSGGPPAGQFESHSAETWQQAIDGSLLSTVHLCRAAVPLMQAAGWGRILCLTSIAAKQPSQSLILSTTARAGVLGFAKALADEVAPAGVTVNVLCPGYFGTDRLYHLAETRATASGRTAEDVLRDMSRTVPIGRLGLPDEFATAALFLASDPARYVTGTALSVDGGLTRSIL